MQRYAEAGFRTFAERETVRVPQRNDPGSVDLPLPEDVYEELVPLLRSEVQGRWKCRIEEPSNPCPHVYIVQRITETYIYTKMYPQ